nr:immunoglobulin light chain junction region [Macaca mulatta]MOX70407.1 immunoglobulin light chain junction region [Macaca mulatta]MOX71290.1 immunoglobulin light chain junction region [Macaca mulatta]MOX73018.1 immunoglobulin light chain junction region [Macaca mulatta]
DYYCQSYDNNLSALF